MPATVSSNPLDQYCLDKLQKMLDLAMQTAEAASTEGNHKIVLQAVREVTRIVTLITKLGNPSAQKAVTAPDLSKTLPGSAPESDIAALTNGLVQDVLKFFPDLSSNPKTDNLKLGTQNQRFWNQEKGRKSRKTGRY
jgi:hypothetical protein